MKHSGDQTAAELFADAGTYVCRVTYPDGTMLQSDPVVFTAARTEPSGRPYYPSRPVNPFLDVHEDDWYYESVLRMCTEGIMSGTGESLFSPMVNVSRGMMVAMLWRLEGSRSPMEPVLLTMYRGISIIMMRSAGPWSRGSVRAWK